MIDAKTETFKEFIENRGFKLAITCWAVAIVCGFAGGVLLMTTASALGVALLVIAGLAGVAEFALLIAFVWST